MKPAEKKARTKKPDAPSFFRELGDFMKPYRGGYGASVLLSVLGVAAGVSSYAFMGAIADNLFSGTVRWTLILYLTLGAVLGKLLCALLRNVSTWISHRAAYNTLRDIRLGISRKLLRLPLGYFEEHGTGRIKTMLVDHIESMEKTLAHLLPEMTADLLAPAACMVWMLCIDWRLGLAVLGWILLGFSVTGGMMKDYDKKYAGQLAASRAMNQAVVEYVGGIEVIKNFGRGDQCYEKYRKAVWGHADYNVNWQKETRRYASLGMAIAPFSLFPVLILGLLFWKNGTLEAGTLLLVLILTFALFGPLMNAMNYFDQLAAMGTDAREIRNVLDYPELKRAGTRKPASGEVEFSHVSFSYGGSAGPAVKDVSFRVPEGTMLALVGPSGGGKSTIGKLLAGYWDAREGQIRVGGVPLESCSQEDINRTIAYVDQDTFLFDRSILENIRMGNPAAEDGQVREVARRAGCDDFIRALPRGYDTVAGARGGQALSGGERQRIAIARAMMKDAPILILDEATASTDPENEASIQASLSAAAMGRKTLLVIAHRLPTVVHAQQIAYVQKGRILAVGTHESLLRDCPEYARLWAMGEGREDA